jgi:hypothetical protein
LRIELRLPAAPQRLDHRQDQVPHQISGKPQGGGFLPGGGGSTLGRAREALPETAAGLDFFPG